MSQTYARPGVRLVTNENSVVNTHFSYYVEGHVNVYKNGYWGDVAFD
jgi:hypothetical protein